MPLKSILKTSNSSSNRSRNSNIILPSLTNKITGEKHRAAAVPSYSNINDKFFFQPFAINSLSNATPRSQIMPYSWNEQGDQVATLRESERNARAVLAALEHHQRVKANLLASAEDTTPYEFSTTYSSDFVQMTPIEKL
jgi:hypothetical protein